MDIERSRRVGSKPQVAAAAVLKSCAYIPDVDYFGHFCNYTVGKHVSCHNTCCDYRTLAAFVIYQRNPAEE